MSLLRLYFSRFRPSVLCPAGLRQHSDCLTSAGRGFKNHATARLRAQNIDKISIHRKLTHERTRRFSMASQDLVLVTGGSGFVGVHCIVALLRENYRVRTTLRSPKRTDEVREMIKVGGISEEKIKGVEFAVADLTKDDGWTEACSGCTYVLHVASPFPAEKPKDPDELIVPAREGTLRALRAAKQAGTVKRVVVTGSTASVGTFNLAGVRGSGETYHAVAD